MASQQRSLTPRSPSGVGKSGADVDTPTALLATGKAGVLPTTPVKKERVDGGGPSEPRICGAPMRWVSLVSLTLQTTAQVLVIKWARAERYDASGAARPRYLSSTVVLFTEVLKTCVSFALVAAESGGPVEALGVVAGHFSRAPLEALNICVPSLLYTLQNNLMFFSLGKLSAAVQQVTYQLKILTTALLSVLILGRVLTSTKWCALVLLLGGIALVQWPRGTGPAGADAGGPGRAAGALAVAGWGDEALGFAAVLAACFTSGLASVYLEKLLKQTDASIWLRNVQLGAFGSLMASVVAFAGDGHQIASGGLTQGYSARVVCVVATNALGGLLCAAVLKYADNILRCFSTALSIVLTCVVSFAVLQEQSLDAPFVVGALMAIAATFLYSAGPPAGLSCRLARVKLAAADR